jgi:acyl-CoA synthetase (AMP-forming)/AMP-acid ligase II
MSVANGGLVPWAAEFLSLAARFGGRVAVTDERGSINYHGLVAHAATMSKLLTEMGVGPGDRVATLVENSVEAVWVSWSILLTGACEVTLNPAQGSDELAWCVKLVSPKVLVHDENSPQPDIPTSIQVIACREVIDAGGILRTPVDLSHLPAAPGDGWSRILFTSGTTGRPKGVVHTHFGRWLAALLLRHSISARVRNESTLLMTPFSHGASLLSFALLLDGSPIHLVRGVNRAVVEPLIRGGAVGHVFAPPTALTKLVDMFAGEQISTVRTILTGTAALSAKLYAETRGIFGPRVRVTYGMTEIFNPITVLDPEECDRLYAERGESAASIVGWPAPGVQLLIRDELGRPVVEGELGQVFVRAGHMYAGYLRAGAEFEVAPDLHATGDIGRWTRDSGLHLLGRLHDTIKTGGYKVLPDEVEGALRERGLNGEIVVLGLSSEYWGQVITCARAGNDDIWFEAALKAAAPLPRHKQPRIFVTVPEIWKNAIGKVDRSRVRHFIEERFTLADGPYPELRVKALKE